MKGVVWDRRFNPPVPMREIDGELKIDRRLQRLLENLCPDCPGERIRRQRGGGRYCRCCRRAWLRQPDGDYAEQTTIERFCDHTKEETT